MLKWPKRFIFGRGGGRVALWFLGWTCGLAEMEGEKSIWWVEGAVERKTVDDDDERNDYGDTAGDCSVLGR